MLGFIQYLLKVCLCTGVILLMYALLVRGKTFFKLNRIFLIGGLVLSFMLPLISLPKDVTNNSKHIAKISLATIKTEYISFAFVDKETVSLDDYTPLIILLYAAGVCFFTYRFASGIATVLRLKKSSLKTHIHNHEVYLQNAFPPFSFVNLIFVQSNVPHFVLKHERTHIEQMHWLDNLLLELASIILWFNPLMIWFKRAVKTQHEFLADQAAVNEYPDVHAYMIYLLKTSMSDYRLSVTSHFESNTIKQRIIMLTKNKTPRQYAIIYSLAIPAMAIILFAFQGSDPAKNAAGVDRPTTEDASVVTTQDVPSGAPIDRSEVQKLFLFGERMNTSTNKMQHHSGLDFVTRAGIKVMATADGIVSEAKFDEIKGNYIVIKHSDEFATQYFHLQSLDVKAGAVLKKGEAIGRVGNTGLSAGSHLHYEVLQHGNAVDPIDFVPEEIKEIVK